MVYLGISQGHILGGTMTALNPDFHRIVRALKPIYGARWISAGGSKGGSKLVSCRGRDAMQA